MEFRNVKPRAIIFDVYGTLLEVGPPPPDGETRWQRLWDDHIKKSPRLSRLEFAVASSREIVRRHEAAHVQGIQFPEIHWPSVISSIAPELAKLTIAEVEEFAFRQIQTGHTTRLFPGVSAVLQKLRNQGFALGLASNAQAYTIRELGQALASAGLDAQLFDPHLCFWSFEHGFSKPDPHVFRILTARLEERGIAASEILMVGDRVDNDIDPARAHGWQTWLITSVESSRPHSGTWRQFTQWLEKH